MKAARNLFRAGRISIRVLCVWTLLGTAACAGLSAQRRPSVRVSPAVSDLLLREMRRRVDPEDGTPSMRRIVVSVDTSRVVPGMVLYWGFYSPPRTAHVGYIVLVGERNGIPRVINTPADWSAVAAEWSPISRKEALTACEELVYATSERRLPGLYPTGYQDSASLRNLPIPNPGFLVSRLTAPVIAMPSPGTWTVSFWAVEPRDVAEYHCKVGQGSASLTRGQVHESYGLYTPMP